MASNDGDGGVARNEQDFTKIAALASLCPDCCGAGLLAYRYYTHPVTLTVAVGSIDGEAAKAMSHPTELHG